MKTPKPMTGTALKRFRNKHKLTQKALADIWGCSLNNIAKLEAHGDNLIPRQSQKVAIMCDWVEKRLAEGE